MGLLNKTVWVKWNSSNKKWYEFKGYIFTKIGDEFEVKVGDLSNGSNSLVDIQCDCCGEILENIKWYSYLKYVHKDGKYYCKKCGSELFGREKYKKTKLKNGKSFYQWCYKNLSKDEADKIMARWDYELNKVKPEDVNYGSQGFNRKGYWFKCLDHLKHKSELKNISSFTGGQSGSLNCKQCNSIENILPHLSVFLMNKDDATKYSYGSNKKIPMKCPDCGYEKEMRINDLKNQDFGCSKCSDGISYSNKFCFDFLEQLKHLNKIKDFENEKTFDWLKYEFKNRIHKGRLDFYFELNNKKYGIEMDGHFHTNDNSMSGQTAGESLYIDNEKDRLCQEHGVKIIRIDSLKSEWQYIKNNIMNSELPFILNFKEEGIDWLKCHKYACNSLVRVVCNLWNNGAKISEISNILKINRNTVASHLRKGVELNWCNYDPVKEKNKYYEQLKTRCRKIICLTTNKIFNSIKEAGNRYQVPPPNIVICCQGKHKYAGKHPITGEKLRWMYYDEYIKLQEAN